MSNYLLSYSAQQDIDSIYNFGQNKFGLNQAKKYLIEMTEIIENLAIHPYLGRKREEIDEMTYSFVYHKHIILYQVEPDRILIDRILHGSRDIPNYLKEN